MKRVMVLIAGYLGFIKLTGKDKKKAAEWGFLFSVSFIVPLFFMSDASEFFKVGMQLMWGACVSRSAILANDSRKKKKTLQ